MAGTPLATGDTDAMWVPSYYNVLLAQNRDRLPEFVVNAVEAQENAALQNNNETGTSSIKLLLVAVICGAVLLAGVVMFLLKRKKK